MKLNKIFSNNQTMGTAILLYLLAVVFYSFDPLLQTTPSIMVNQLMADLSVTSLGIGVIASSYYYSYNSLQMLSGMLSDKFGVKNILLISCCLSFWGLILFSFSKNEYMAIMARVLMGTGSASAAAILIIISNSIFKPHFLPIMIGFAQLVANLGSIGGQLPMSIMVDRLGWKASVALLSLVPIIIAILLIYSMKSNTISVKEKKTSFIKEAVQVIKNKNNWIISLYGTSLWTAFYIFASLWGIQYMVLKYHFSVTHASLLMSICWIGSGIGSVLTGIIARYFSKKSCLILLSIVGFISFTIILSTHLSTSLLSILLFIFGISSGGQAFCFALLTEHNNHEMIGTAAGFLNTIIMLGTMIFDPIIGWMIKLSWDGKLENGTPIYSLHSFDISFTVILFLLILSGVISIFYKDVHQTNQFP